MPSASSSWERTTRRSGSSTGLTFPTSASSMGTGSPGFAGSMAPRPMVGLVPAHDAQPVECRRAEQSGGQQRHEHLPADADPHQRGPVNNCAGEVLVCGDADDVRQDDQRRKLQLSARLGDRSLRAGNRVGRQGRQGRQGRKGQVSFSPASAFPHRNTSQARTDTCRVCSYQRAPGRLPCDGPKPGPSWWPKHLPAAPHQDSA